MAVPYCVTLLPALALVPVSGPGWPCLAGIWLRGTTFCRFSLGVSWAEGPWGGLPGLLCWSGARPCGDVTGVGNLSKAGDSAPSPVWMAGPELSL